MIIDRLVLCLSLALLSCVEIVAWPVLVPLSVIVINRLILLDEVSQLLLFILHIVVWRHQSTHVVLVAVALATGHLEVD